MMQTKNAPIRQVIQAVQIDLEQLRNSAVAQAVVNNARTTGLKLFLKEEGKN